VSRKRKPAFNTAGPRRQPPRWQRDRNIARLITIIVVAVVLVVVALVAYWAYSSQIAPWKEPVIRVNDTVFDMDYFIKRMRIVPQDTSEYTVARQIKDGELARQGAAPMGISVLPGNITDAIESYLIDNYSSETNPDPTQEQIDEWYDHFRGFTGFTEEEVRGLFEIVLLEQQVWYHFRDNDVPETGKHVHLLRLIRPTEEEALEALEQLNAGNETVTAELQSGDVGWVPKGVLPDLDDIAFDLEPGELRGPVSTDQGFELIKVVEVDEDRELSENHRTILTNDIYEQWLEDLWLSGTVEDYLDADKIAWVRDHLY
jgi:hypothetical protein